RPYDEVTKPNAPGTGMTWPVFHGERVSLVIPGGDAGVDGPAADAPVADAPIADAMTDAMADGGTPDASPPDAPPNDAPPTMGAIVGSFAAVELAEIDPSTGAPIASSTNTCNATDMYLNLGDISVGDMAFAAIDHPMMGGGSTTTRYRLYHALPQGAEGGNILAVELWEQFGTYSMGVHTGAVALTGQEANFNTCGACVIIYAKINSMNQYSQAYIATAGTLTIDGF